MSSDAPNAPHDTSANNSAPFVDVPLSNDAVSPEAYSLTGILSYFTFWVPTWRAPASSPDAQEPDVQRIDAQGSDIRGLDARGTDTQQTDADDRSNAPGPSTGSDGSSFEPPSYYTDSSVIKDAPSQETLQEPIPHFVSIANTICRYIGLVCLVGCVMLSCYRLRLKPGGILEPLSVACSFILLATWCGVIYYLQRKERKDKAAMFAEGLQRRDIEASNQAGWKNSEETLGSGSHPESESHAGDRAIEDPPLTAAAEDWRGALNASQ